MKNPPDFRRIFYVGGKYNDYLYNSRYRGH